MCPTSTVLSLKLIMEYAKSCLVDDKGVCKVLPSKKQPSLLSFLSCLL